MEFPPTDWPDYDPDLADFAVGETVLTTAGVRVLGVTFTNTSGAGRQVTVKDAAGKTLLNNVDVPESGVDFSRDFPMVKLTGISVVVVGGTGVTGKVWGWLV